MANIIHEAFIYQGRTLAAQTQHGPVLTHSDLPTLEPDTYHWCIACRCWVHDWREELEPLTVNPVLVESLASKILVLERNGHEA